MNNNSDTALGSDGEIGPKAVALATRADAQHAGCMLRALEQSWQGVLDADETEGSPLACELNEQGNYATLRLAEPIGHVWSYAQGLRAVADDHEAIARESLLRFGRGEGPAPIVSLETMTRVILEVLACQRWIISTEPPLDTRGRYSRWLAVEFKALSDDWKIIHQNPERVLNPHVTALIADADMNGIARDQCANPRWVGDRPPSTVVLAEELLARFPAHVPGRPPALRLGNVMYRLFSPGMHGGAGRALTSLIPTATTTPTGRITTKYALTTGTLWRSVAVILLATFTARCEYARWLGVDVPAEARRLHLHHIDHARSKLETPYRAT